MKWTDTAHNTMQAFIPRETAPQRDLYKKYEVK